MPFGISDGFCFLFLLNKGINMKIKIFLSLAAILTLLLAVGSASASDGFAFTDSGRTILLTSLRTQDATLAFSLSLRQDEESAVSETVNQKNVFIVSDGKLERVADEFTTLYRADEIPLAVSRMDFTFPFEEKISHLDEFQILFPAPELIVGNMTESEQIRIPLENPIAMVFNSREAGMIGGADPIGIEYPSETDDRAVPFELRTNNHFTFSFENISIEDILTFDWIVKGDYLKSVVLENPATFIEIRNRDGAFDDPPIVAAEVSAENDSTAYAIRFELSIPDGMNRENISGLRFDLGNPQFRLKYLNEKLEPSLWVRSSELPIRFNIAF